MFSGFRQVKFLLPAFPRLQFYLEKEPGLLLLNLYAIMQLASIVSRYCGCNNIIPDHRLSQTKTGFGN
jgi:hypothetical protein